VDTFVNILVLFEASTYSSKPRDAGNPEWRQYWGKFPLMEFYMSYNESLTAILRFPVAPPEILRKSPLIQRAFV
jgi:hypothetical protein